MKYYLIAGEASGDLHGSNLIKELKKLDTAADIRCWGGDLMQQTGAVLVKHYKDHAFMGFAEVVMNLRTITNNLRFCKQDIQQFQPDVLVLINFSGFNLRIAEWAKQQGFKIVFYISPQVWAWKEGRVKKMKQNIDKMLVVLPFEKDYYKNKWNWNVEYVGHPLVQVIEDYKIKHSQEPSTFDLQPSNTQFTTLGIVALLPGSRKQEILKKLPVMLEVTRSFPLYHFVVAKAPGQEDIFYEELLKPYPNVSSVRDTYNLLLHAKAALVTSGTATLETALFGVPEVVCYKGSNISYQIAKRLIRVKYISLVNLIMDKLVVKELIQNELNTKNLERELLAILTDEEKIKEIKSDYAALKKLLSQGGDASANAAKSIYVFLAKEWIA
jgi:lipid-A-disaccharide synthase